MDKVIIEELNDADEKARFHAGQARFELNRNWLESHWQDLLSQAPGRFVAVACQEAQIADSVGEAWAWVDEHYPEDDGPLSALFVHREAHDSMRLSGSWRPFDDGVTTPVISVAAVAA